jgi:hypothetical protein
MSAKIGEAMIVPTMMSVKMSVVPKVASIDAPYLWLK